MPEEVRPLPAGDTAAPGGAKASEVTSPVDDNSVGSGSPTAGPSQAQAAPLPQPAMTTTSQPSAQPTPDPTAAVRIRIPAIGVDRAIIEVPLTHDTRTGTWERDYSLLFRRPGKDLVGHWVGSALPGQPGNTILVGHNYGYGYNGVFLRLGRLKRGQRIEVVNASGQVYTYRVTEVKSIRWKAKNQEELLQHLPYLSVDGPERLTLVTCGGSEWAPFPKRVYVVAEPGP
jgi:LPXTG-site transpeptidase (sortase) family protein